MFVMLFDNYREFLSHIFAYLYLTLFFFAVVMTKPREKDGVTKYHVHRRVSSITLKCIVIYLNILTLKSPYPSTCSPWSTSPTPQYNDQTAYSVPCAVVIRVQIAFAVSEMAILAPALPRSLQHVTWNCLHPPPPLPPPAVAAALRVAVAVKRAHRKPLPLYLTLGAPAPLPLQVQMRTITELSIHARSTITVD